MLLWILLILSSLWLIKVFHSYFISPLKAIPGPLLLQFFPIIYTYYLVIGKDFEYLLYLHNQYGEVVRVGWNLLSFATDDLSKEIFATYKFRKGDIYKKFRAIGMNIFNATDRDFHRNRKRMVAPSFSDAAILSYEPIVKEINLFQLTKKIKALHFGNNSSIDLGALFHCVTFDIIGELSFGKSFDMVESGYHPIFDWVRSNAIHSAIKGGIPILEYVPEASKKIFKFTEKVVEQRLEETNYFKESKGRTTVLENLVKTEDADTGKRLSLKEVAEESILQLIAGSETTSNGLLWTFYMLLKHPSMYTQLRQELRARFPTLESISFETCQTECPYLSAIIHESLRMYPPASTLLPRIPLEDTWVQHYFLPKGTLCGISPYVVHNFNQNWVSPRQFLPERWLNDKNQFVMHSNFIPFISGPRACIGRNLAWMELYITIAGIVWSFELELLDPNLFLDPVSRITFKPKNGSLLVKVCSMDSSLEN